VGLSFLAGDVVMNAIKVLIQNLEPKSLHSFAPLSSSALLLSSFCFESWILSPDGHTMESGWVTS
jgi:hypothetical protein